MSAFRIPTDEFIPLPLYVKNAGETDKDVLDDDENDEDELEEEDEDGPVDEDDEFVIDDEEDDEDDEADDEDLDTDEALDEDDELDEERDAMRIRRQQIEDEQQTAGYQREAEARDRRDEEVEAQRIKDNEDGAAMEEDDSSDHSSTGL